MKLNIGCGNDIRAGWINMDIDPKGDDVLKIDLEHPHFLLKDNSVDVIVANDVLEHIHGLIQLMNECWRVMKPGGKFHIEVPLFPTKESVADPTHVRFFVPKSFRYFTHDDEAMKMYGIKPWKGVFMEVSEDRIKTELQKPV